MDPLEEHHGYLTDSVRSQRYAEATARAVRPGDVVLDLGCGTGILGLQCLKAGAEHVVALDETSILEVARQTYARAGVADRCTFISGRSYTIDLGRRVDLIVCDHVGYFGLDYGIAGLMRDARNRFLKPNGRIVPKSIKLFVALAGGDVCKSKTTVWNRPEIAREYHWLVDFSLNTKHAIDLSAENVLSSPAGLATIDLTTEDRSFFRFDASLHAAAASEVDGIAGWFDCELVEGVRMTNSPLAGECLQRHQVFLPTAEPATVRPGERVDVTIAMRPDDGFLNWSVRYPDQNLSFRHSSWLSSLLSKTDFTRTQPNRVPVLSANGKARLIVLGYCDGKRSTAEIEKAVLTDHPELFPSASEISRFVFDVLGRDTV